MKIYIITLHRAENYGSVLQALALQERLKSLGNDVTILDYWPERYTNKGLLKRLKGKSDKFKNPILLLAAKVLRYPSYLRKNKVFGRFIHQYLKLSEKSFDTNESAIGMFDDADAYCTGSDQVWNSHWNEGVEKALFLDFAPKNKLIFSYASSIGLSTLPENEIDVTKDLLKRYEYISVREDTGLKIMYDLGRKDAVQCLDPVFLLKKDKWDKLASNQYNGKKYILTYNLHHDPEIDKYAQTISLKYGIPVYNISYNWHDVIRKGRLKWCPSVEDFLGLIKNASFVIADSFHATAFSIIFERQFITIIPEVASSRISSLLKILNLSDRLESRYTDISVLEKHIDYDNVRKLLYVARNESDMYLQHVISCSSFTRNK